MSSYKSLKNYQEKAVDKLIARSNELLKDNSIKNKTIVFQSPTGSGKTYMLSQYIKQIIEEQENTELCFLWISIGKGDLHTQTYDSLCEEYDYVPSVFLLEQEFGGNRWSVAKNEVVVVNWEKLRAKDNQTGEWKNILMKDSENVNFRELMKNTRDERKIIMIIDESHSNSTSERALELRDKIVIPDLTIEVSATPVLREGLYHEKITVPATKVIEEGMIKKEIIINENINEIVEDEISSQELVLTAAYNKRELLKHYYKEEESDVNPLVLIQIPTAQAGEDKKEFAERFLAEKGITADTGRLAVWLSEEKVNQEKYKLTRNDSKVDFLIFKQAIDTGWDCPRSQILVKFREIKSQTFEIQTVGRILRMPEAEHYSNEALNTAYIYTNLTSINVKKEDYNPNIIKSINVKRNDDIYTNIELKSYFKPRIDYGDITYSFYQSLYKVFCEHFSIDFDVKNIEDVFFLANKRKVSEKFDTENLEKLDRIILNKEISTAIFDELDKKEIKTLSNYEVNFSEEDLQYTFESLIKINLNGFASKRSMPIVKNAVYSWFKKYTNLQYENNGKIYVQRVCVKNGVIFSMLIDQAVREYIPVKKAEVKKRAEEAEKINENWEIQQNINYNPHTYKKFEYKSSILQPCYLNIDSKIEQEFVEYIEKNNQNILWWHQNGSEHMKTNFGIKYLKNDMPHSFQPDFLIMFKTGKLGIYDTKPIEDREEDAKLKSEALQKYITEEIAKGKNLTGGIIIKNKSHFMLNSKMQYNSFNKQMEDWDYFDKIAL